MQLQTLREKIAIGIEQSDRGELLDGEEVFQELLEDVEQIRQARSDSP